MKQWLLVVQKVLLLRVVLINDVSLEYLELRCRGGGFLPMYLIYKGKTVKSLPRFKFPQGFCLSANEKYFSNRVESVKYLEEIIVPYFKKQRSIEGLDKDQKTHGYHGRFLLGK